MLQTLKNAWKTKEIRNKILFTVFILLLYRIGTVIPVPFIDATTFSSSFNGTILAYLNTLSGGSLGTATLFALGVSPYINASIIIQLLGVVFPKLGELAKDDKEKMNFITRVTAVGLAIVTALGYYFLLKKNGAFSSFATAEDNNAAWFVGIVIVACYVAGAMIIMWLGDRISEHGIGNGISMILFANIISEVPSFAIQLGSIVVGTYSYGEKAWLYAIVSTLLAILLLAFFVALVGFVVFVTGSERRIPVQYAKKVVGRKMYGGQSTNLPIKLNMTGVMPIIFASSIVSLIPTILMLCGIDGTGEKFWDGLYNVLGSDGVIYPIALFLLIIGFAYFYTQITFDPIEVANNLKKNGGAIPGIRQGRPTADYIRKILNKVTFVGALFLGVIAILPTIASPLCVQPLLTWVLKDPALAAEYEASGALSSFESYIESQASSLAGTFTFGGTTLLIVVGVAIETFQQLEAQLTMRNYKGFLN